MEQEEYLMNEWTCDECKHKDVSVDSYPCEACYGGSLYESEEGSENHEHID